MDSEIKSKVDEYQDYLLGRYDLENKDPELAKVLLKEQWDVNVSGKKVKTVEVEGVLFEIVPPPWIIVTIFQLCDLISPLSFQRA